MNILKFIVQYRMLKFSRTVNYSISVLCGVIIEMI